MLDAHRIEPRLSISSLYMLMDTHVTGRFMRLYRSNGELICSHAHRYHSAKQQSIDITKH
jgi:hypothetical protein